MFALEHKARNMAGEPSKERQSVYDKALNIFRKGEKSLSKMNQELEKHKLQKYIDYKLEERKLQMELIGLRKEQKRLAKETFKRHREHKTIDDIAKELKKDNRAVHFETVKLEKKFDKLPQVNISQKNFPQILRRTLSHESEYYTWTLGLPKITSNTTSSLRSGLDQPNSALKKIEKNGQIDEETEQQKKQRRESNQHKIVYSIPLSERKLNISDSVNTKLPALPALTTKDGRGTKPKLSKLPEMNT